MVRKANQDALGCFPELGLFVVADGMGGRSEGEVASRLAVESIHAAMAPELGAAAEDATEPPAERGGFWRSLRGTRSAADPGPDLEGAVGLANRRVHEAGHSQPASPRGSMGTTVVVLVCVPQRQRAYWAHVGDSRLYRVRDGELALLTADHTMFGEEFWGQGRVPPDLPHTNRLVRAVGIEPTVRATCGADALQPGDLFLLCSDGVSGMVTPDELRQQLLDGQPLKETGEALIRLALAAGGRDNASAILVRA
ncbi:MAG: PP2C family protein-serine/threonine phosphatase [Candidatus Binatia bacterium]